MRHEEVEQQPGEQVSGDLILKPLDHSGVYSRTVPLSLTDSSSPYSPPKAYGTIAQGDDVRRRSFRFALEST